MLGTCCFNVGTDQCMCLTAEFDHIAVSTKVVLEQVVDGRIESEVVACTCGVRTNGAQAFMAHREEEDVD